MDARVSLAEKSREQEVALAVTKAEEALRAQIAERDGQLARCRSAMVASSARASSSERGRRGSITRSRSCTSS